MSDGRLIIVSNRLPIAASIDNGELVVAPSVGGLATGLRGPHEQGDGLWIGWPGDVSGMDDGQRAELERRLVQMRTVPIHLSPSEIAEFYDGFANEVLWPLFHYLLDIVPQDPHGWETYQAVNQRFADAVVEGYRPGDTIWVHDYQLMLVPSLVRQRLPGAKIGFFLHIPFPSTEIFRTLAWRKELLLGLLGADLIGFHTFTYMRHFATALLRFLGLESTVDHVEHEGREVRLGVFPMGVDVAAFEAMAKDPRICDDARAIRGEHEGQKLVFGLDRLDYTKGIPRRLLAIDRLLAREPSLRDRLRFIQVAVPSRERVLAYGNLRSRIEESVGHINGTYGSTVYTPIQYVSRAQSLEQVTALYKATDVMLVTPLRDGMNLVAKEFIASREDGDGVLVLSELAGAAAELGDALLVNPYDIDQVATSLQQAFAMPTEERRARMAGLRARVKAFDVHAWVGTFLAELEAQPSVSPPMTPLREGPARLTRTLQALVDTHDELILLLDYDGTLVPTAARPELARPDEEVMALLRALAARPKTHVHFVTGRSRGNVERWFGELPIALYAEHGAWSRSAVGAPWVVIAQVPPAVREQALRILRQFARRTPGTFVEEKEVGVAWHYRAAELEFGALQATELRLHLAAALSNAPVEVIQGDKVVEVRPHGVNKGLVARRALADASKDPCVLCIGNDRTDEDMFAALPPPALTVHVGPGRSAASHYLADVGAVRDLLRTLLP